MTNPAAISEHMEVVGSDRGHVGRVDHLRGDQIELAKNDPDANMTHHMIPVSWVEDVEGETIRLSKTADEVKQEWQSSH